MNTCNNLLLLLLITCMFIKLCVGGKYKSCEEIQKDHKSKIDGVYKIYPEHLDSLMKVYCEGDWMVIQRRYDGVYDFARTWNDYKVGFGKLSKEFWFGNDKLSGLTTAAGMKIRFDLTDKNDNSRYAVYSHFQVAPESEKYKLTITGYEGTAGDAMKHHNGFKFSTKDNDNDGAEFDCSVKDGGAGGWWFNRCIDANLNGKYLVPGSKSKSGVTWDMWQNRISMKKSKISISYV